jgi:glycosyltransferase involved in cell wall biosynthesis
VIPDQPERSLRVLFVEQQAPETGIWDGVGSYTAATTKALAAEGHEVHQLACGGWQRSRDVEVNGVHIHYRPELHAKGLRYLLRLPGLRGIHRRWLDHDAEVLRDFRLSLSNYVAYRRLGIDFDVIEASSYPRQSLFFALFHTKPIVLTRHGLSWQQLVKIFDIPSDAGGYADDYPQLPAFAKIRLRLNDVEAHGAQLVTVASDVMSEARTRASTDGVQARVVPCIVEPGSWSSIPPVDTTGPVVLSVGRLEPIKACHLLVHAAARLAPEVEGLQVVFVGSGTNGVQGNIPYDEWLRKLAVDLQAPCTFIDRMPREELTTWYARARVLAIPSWFENYPMVGLEAMSGGRPIVVTERNGYAQRVKELGAGTVIPHGDVPALADALRHYLLDPHAAAVAGANGKAFIETQHTAQQIARERADVYRDAIELWRAEKRDPRAWLRPLARSGAH